MTDHRPFRDGKVHVLAEQCSTCVFRGGNLMHLAPGRVKELVTDNVEADSALQCHQTLPYSDKDRPGAVCRGFFDAYADQTVPLRLAKAVGVVVFDA